MIILSTIPNTSNDDKISYTVDAVITLSNPCLTKFIISSTFK